MGTEMRKEFDQETDSCWLSPTGRVVYAETWKHHIAALEIIADKYREIGIEKGLIQFYDGDPEPFLGSNGDFDDCVEFLNDLGWLSYKSWTVGERWYGHKQPTKKQIQTMFEITPDYCQYVVIFGHKTKI